MKHYLVAILTIISLQLEGQSLEINSKNGTDIEIRGKEQLERLIEVYSDKIKHWIFTKEIAIDQSTIPFSHPILTLNCRYLDEDLKQLSTFLHEQFHWYVLSRQVQEKQTIAEFKKLYPQVPVKGKEGAQDDYSSYLHLIVCDLEYQAMTKILGEQPAKHLMSEWTHYTWIYDKVINDKKIREINTKHGMIIP